MRARLLPYAALVLCWSAGLLSPARAGVSCTVSTSGVAFGNYDPTSAAPVSVIGSLGFTCTVLGLGVGTTGTITLSTGASGSFTNRMMTYGGQSLLYNLYADINHTQVFGDGTGSTYEYSFCYLGGSAKSCTGGGNQSGTVYSVPLYGLLPPAQNVAAGTYSDSIIATITF